MAPKSMKQILLFGMHDEIGRMRVGVEEQLFLHLATA